MKVAPTHSSKVSDTEKLPHLSDGMPPISQPVEEREDRSNEENSEVQVGPMEETSSTKNCVVQQMHSFQPLHPPQEKQ